MKELLAIEQELQEIQEECNKRAIEYQAAIDNTGLSYCMKPSTKNQLAEENQKRKY